MRGCLLGTTLLLGTSVLAADLRRRGSGSSEPSPTIAANGVETPNPPQPGMVDNCDTFHLVVGGDNCEAIAAAYNITLEQFAAWNPVVGTEDSNLWFEHYVCVSIVGHEPSSKPLPSPTESASNGIETPDQIQPGMVSNCNKFHLVAADETCETIVSQYDITLSEFATWNPDVGGGDCSGLWHEHQVCVSVIGHEPSVPSTTAAPVQTGDSGVDEVAETSALLPTSTEPVDNETEYPEPTETDSDQSERDEADETKQPEPVEPNNTLWNGGDSKPPATPIADSPCNGKKTTQTPSPTGTAGGPGPDDDPGCPHKQKKPAGPPETVEAATQATTTPRPYQTGMAAGCKAFHLVKEAESCGEIAEQYKITTAQFLKWNPAAGSRCESLYSDFYACVSVA